MTKRFLRLLAAKRLGLRVIDFQHGLQDHNHFAYHTWRVEPRGGWEVLPDSFWVWGGSARLNNSNRLKHVQVQIFGNPWMNSWKEGANAVFENEKRKARDLVRGAQRTILITCTCPVAPHLEFLKSLVQKAPKDWLWLIRLHPTELRKVNFVHDALKDAGGHILVKRPPTPHCTRFYWQQTFMLVMTRRLVLKRCF